MPRTLQFLCVCLVVVLQSCSSPSGLTAVTGKVTFDGEPLPEGDILFIPADKQFGTEAGKIKSGSYRLNVRPGKNDVQIRATRLVAGQLGPMGEPAIEDYIPVRYNTASKLTAEVGPGKTNFDFELKSD